MSCVEKRHMSHRVGSMLHHRFPNGFTDLFMDETDREVSTLTDRAFRSLCVGDDAVYSDEFLCGYSPFNCHKPLAGEPLKRTHHKESKKQGQSKNSKNESQPWKQQQKNNMSEMSSFLKALSATEESCEGLLIKNGGMTDSNGESWDKSALRSIQRELSEFSSDYHTSFTDSQFKNHLQHESGNGSSNKMSKDAGLPSGKSSKTKNKKSNVKLKKLNIKNFFLHSEFSPFQTWTDIHRFAFGQEDTVASILPISNIPKWYDLPFYKELTEAHTEETLDETDSQSGQNKEQTSLHSPSSPPKPSIPLLPSPPKVLPKPPITLSEKRCTSEGGDGAAAPWRRNRSRAKSAIPVNLPGLPPQDSSKTVDESPSWIKKETKSVKVTAVEDVSSLASTPFSICQLMTPLIPSRQPTETSEILQGVLSPLALDLSLRPHSEAKVTPEPPIKRDSYKALASSILFNLKDNRKRVKSRYSPAKFKTLELPESGLQSPQSDHVKLTPFGSEGNASGLSTPAILKDGLSVCSPNVECALTSNVGERCLDTDRPMSDDYLLTNLLQTKRDATGNGSLGDENALPHNIHSKKNKSPMAKKQNYPSLNLYSKADSADPNISYAQEPSSTSTHEHRDPPAELNEVSSPRLNKELFSKPLLTDTSPSSNTLNVIKDAPPGISPRHDKEGQKSVGHPNIMEQIKWPVKEAKENNPGVQQTSKEKDTSGQTLSTRDVIRAAREAINAAKSKVLSANHSDPNTEELRQKETHLQVSKEPFSSKSEISPIDNKVLPQKKREATPSGRNSNIKKEPPPVPKRNFGKSEIQLALEKQQLLNDRVSNGDFEDSKKDKLAQKQSKHKHVFSARQNNYIKYQRYAVTDDEREDEEGYKKVDSTREKVDERMSEKEARDSEHLVSDLHALKEIEKTRLGDSFLENVLSKLAPTGIDEEAKAKNDLISRELRNIKRGMLSMRGNTSAKRDIFVKKEKEQSKNDVFSRLDSNVIVNKTLINDNYDKAKMALEEIISEREKRKNHNADQSYDEKLGDEMYDRKSQQQKNRVVDHMAEIQEKPTSGTAAMKQKDVKERLEELRDDISLRQIMSQTEPRQTPRTGGSMASTGADKTGNELNVDLKSRAKYLRDNPSNAADISEINSRQKERQIFEGSGEYLMKETETENFYAPPVPPRFKKGDNRSNENTTADIDAADEDVLNRNAGLNELKSGSGVQVLGEKNVADYSKNSSDTAISDTYEPSLMSEFINIPHLSPKGQANELRENLLELRDPRSEASPVKSSRRAQETCETEEKTALKSIPIPDDNAPKSPGAEEPNKICKVPEDANIHADTPINIRSPLLLVNGLHISQSPPDQSSLSSKSSYFSAESALQRNTESESNVYHSMENLIGEVEEADEAAQSVPHITKQDSERADAEYYSLSDHESEHEVVKRPVQSPQDEFKESHKNSQETEITTVDPGHDEHTAITLLTNTFSPTLGIPALFKVKDNTFTNKLRKTIQPWSPRGNLIGTEKVEEESPQSKENPVHLLVDEDPTSTHTSLPAETFEPEEIPLNSFMPVLLSPSNLPDENPKKRQDGNFLTVPQEEDRLSGVSPSSEGVESFTTSAADTADEMTNTERLVESEVTNLPSERSGSTGSGNSGQQGLPKPPAVLPKSEKAVLKAIKLSNRRIKKEEAHKSSQKSSQSSTKHRSERHRSDKSEHKSSKASRSGERKHREKPEDGQHHEERHRSKNSYDQTEQTVGNDECHHNQTDMSRKTWRQSHDSLEREDPVGLSSERQGRSSNRPDHRHYSSNRVFSNVPVYKAQLTERPSSDRPYHRTQSIDRYMGDATERRLSADMSAADRLDPRLQRVEKSIMDEFQQRGRARDKASRDNPLRRSHSIDAYSSEGSHPNALSRQSSYGSPLSRQSSLEHAIVTQSFPITQRKLLQDPDSGQFFFVDMPVQVKTKTFFDPETGSYVQLPVQPPDGAGSQVSPMEVLPPSMVVYHGFVPVPLSPMAQKANVQPPRIEADEFKQRHQERLRQTHGKEGRPYLEPVFAQQDLMLGEFMGTEELDCPR